MEHFSHSNTTRSANASVTCFNYFRFNFYIFPILSSVTGINPISYHSENTTTVKAL